MLIVSGLLLIMIARYSAAFCAHTACTEQYVELDALADADGAESPAPQPAGRAAARPRPPSRMKNRNTA